MSEVVIGEAVVLDLRPARLPSRALAFALDALIMAIVFTAVLVALALAGDDFDPALRAAVGIVVLVGVFVGYPLVWETLSRGRSPGKFAMGLRVVRDDGGPIRFRHALSRALSGLIVDFGLLSGFTGFFGVVVSASSSRGKRIGDLLAGTVVMRERVPRTASRSGELPEVHPQLAGWATGLELSRVPDDLALAARQFLLRADRLDFGVRASLGERLAGDVASRVAPPPPSGVPAEAYLAAVMGERRRREIHRLGGTPSGGPGQPGPPQPVQRRSGQGPPVEPGQGPAGQGPPGYPQPGGLPSSSPSPGAPEPEPATGAPDPAAPRGAPGGFAPPG